MRVLIETIPHSQQRYETIGDYWEDGNGVQKICVSDMSNSDYEFLVALHEFVELYLCKKRGIKEEDISAFDIEFERNRLKGNTEEPGDDPSAPYRKEHFTATNIERMIAQELGIDWSEYEKACLEI